MIRNGNWDVIFSYEGQKWLTKASRVELFEMEPDRFLELEEGECGRIRDVVGEKRKRRKLE